jgi:hypothetical protein
VSPWEKVRQIAEAETSDRDLVYGDLTHGDIRALWAILGAKLLDPPALGPRNPVVRLAEVAYCMGAKDAQHLCRLEAVRLAREVRDPCEAMGAARARDAIDALDGARCLPCFVPAVLRVVGAPDAEEHTCADEAVEPAP